METDRFTLILWRDLFCFLDFDLVNCEGRALPLRIQTEKGFANSGIKRLESRNLSVKPRLLGF